MELLNASWNLDAGRTVDLRIIEGPGDHIVHPFKQYTHKRGGRVGTIFQAVIVPTDSVTPAYHDQVMLAGWGEQNGRGMWVRFWLDESAASHPFSGFSRKSGDERGQMFAVVLVEIENEEPIDPVLRAKLERKKTGRRAYSSSVHLMVTSQTFVQWLREKAPAELTAKIERQEGGWNQENARRYVKWVCHLESLADLDHDRVARTRFIETIARPYEQWSGGVSGTYMG